MTAVGDAAPPTAWTRRSVWLARVESPLAPYYLILGSTLALAGIGLVMVLSSSSVTSFKDGGSSYTEFLNQVRFAAIGLPLAWVASRLPRLFWMRMSWPIMVFALAMQGLVFSSLGVEVNGNRNWIEVAGQRIQPSEMCKIALVVWGATVLARKRPLLDRTSHLFVPLVPVVVLVLGLVLLGHDLGTALILMLIVATIVFVAGAPLRWFALGGAGLVVAVLVLAAGSGNRNSRIAVWLAGCVDPNDNLGQCWQPLHGKYALATGGWWGVGLGGSREKWSWLPEAHNDYIFSIIGEELGLPGTLVVLALFGLLALGLYRLVVTSDDVMVKIAAAGTFAWILSQAMMNIGVVVGLLPVIGLPLPLVSSGGSALVTTLFVLGIMLGFARKVPGAPEALAARGSVVKRSLAVMPLRVGREGAR